MVFNVGDKVRFKDDATNQHWSIVNIYPSISKVQILSDCGNILKVVEPLLLVPFDPASEIKQAIREVLLSDEFLAAFAAAWQKTPLIHVDEMKLTIEPITKSASEAVALRNRFGIGDTVVDQFTGSLAIVKNINESDGECEIQFEENHRYAYRWGSELSLFKKKVSDCKPSSIDASAINQNGESK